MTTFLHEQRYRSETVMERLAALPVTLCGAGALGANLAVSLARQGFGRLTVIDRDRVEEHNLSTQPWLRSDIGASKATLIANHLYRATGTTVQAHPIELTHRNGAKLLAGAGLVVDVFDNAASRALVGELARERGLACLHAGLAADYGEVIWDERYTVPSETERDVCGYALARNLVTIVVAVASEVAVRFAANGERASYTVTLRDLAVHPLP